MIGLCRIPLKIDMQQRNRIQIQIKRIALIIRTTGKLKTSNHHRKGTKRKRQASKFKW